ncbi:hypothetical protein FRC12_005836 [Ceratobasidium sp. 428]|nr:hypothetical protein FRC12_005836 [Ceratobasidium sp. 428]
MISDDTLGASRPGFGTQAGLFLAHANPIVDPHPPTIIELSPRPRSLSLKWCPSIPAKPSSLLHLPGTDILALWSSLLTFHPPNIIGLILDITRVLTRRLTNLRIIRSNLCHSGEPGDDPERDAVPAQQCTEITRQLDSHRGDIGNNSFHPGLPLSSTPAGHALADESDPVPGGAPPKLFDEKAHVRIASTPFLSPIGAEANWSSRAGSPINLNPQHAHRSGDARPGQLGRRLGSQQRHFRPHSDYSAHSVQA